MTYPAIEPYDHGRLDVGDGNRIYWVLRDVGRIASIPAVLIHGRMNASAPIDIPSQLAQRWWRSELIIVDDAGHGTSEPGMAEAVLAATDRFV